MTFLTFALAGFHFGSEWLYFKTVKFGKGLAGPLITACKFQLQFQLLPLQLSNIIVKLYRLFG